MISEPSLLECQQVYYPTVREQRVLKNGSCTTKLKPICPGCIFLHCVLNKEIHDCIRECDAVGGFLGFQVGNKYVLHKFCHIFSTFRFSYLQMVQFMLE